MKLEKALMVCQLYEKIKTKVIPISVAFKLSRLYNEFKDNCEFYQKTLGDLINTYAQKDERGALLYSEDKSTILIVPDKIKECNARLHELKNLEIAKPDITFCAEELESLGLSLEEV